MIDYFYARFRYPNKISKKEPHNGKACKTLNVCDTIHIDGCHRDSKKVKDGKC